MKHIIGMFFVLLALFAFNFELLAVPADSRPQKFIQPDGTDLTIMLQGDEWFHFYVTTDSVPLLKKNDCFYYASLNRAGIECSSMPAHNPLERTKRESDYCRENKHELLKAVSLKWSELRSDYNEECRRKSPVIKKLGEIGDYTGEKCGLVILVNYSDKVFTENAPTELEAMFNEVGYSGNNHIGSVHDYFYDQSYGKFNLTFDVVGPVTLSKSVEYYGKNVGDNSDVNVREMVKEACELVDEEVDFSKYDWDGDGEVDQVFLIYAGYGEHAGGPSYTIWPHEWFLADPNFILDETLINTYACTSELMGSRGTTLSGIGTACHEFSHCLGLPDLYDTDKSGAWGMGYLDLMCSGSYSGPNGNAEVPYGYSAFERWMCGWLDLTEINRDTEIQLLPNLGVTPIAYKLINDGFPDEYYILENHQNSRWYQYVHQLQSVHGLMVTHINYNELAWRRNKVNPSKEMQRMSVVCADDNYQNPEYDLFPSELGITELTNSSHLNAGGFMYNPNLDGMNNLNKSIREIKEEGGLISFKIYSPDYTVTPKALPATIIYGNVYRARWNGNINADSYDIELTKLQKGIDGFNIDIFEGIEQNYYDFEDLSTGIYTYRIRMNSNGLSSEWSNKISFSVTSSEISTICSESSNEMLYDLKGKRLNTEPAYGIYLNVEGNKVTKIIKR